MKTTPLLSVRLHFQGGLHLAQTRDENSRGQDYPGSDTLKAALTACHAQLLGGMAPASREAAIRDFMDGFALSSGLPFRGGRSFLPVPLEAWPPPGTPQKQLKALRKVRFISVALFERCYGAAARPRWPHGDGIVVGDGGDAALAWLEQAEAEAPDAARHHVAPMQRVRVARPWAGEDDARPYFVERQSWAGEAGIHFLLQTRDAAVLGQVQAALRLLGDEGMGLGKSVGGGAFTSTCAPLPLHLPADGPHMALGRLLPHVDMAADLPAHARAWAFRPGGGFAAGAREHPRHLLRLPIYLLAEGSTFHADPRPWAQLRDVRPAGHAGHPIWRDGRPLCIPVHLPPHDAHATR
jgi:CRISPR type III-A-associated RAMP protein Csm4